MHQTRSNFNVRCVTCPLRKQSAFRPMKETEVDFISGFKVGEKLYRAGTDIVEEGLADNHIYTLYKGWACRYHMMEDGRRQILSILLPGDLIGLQSAMFTEPEHSVSALTNVTLCVFERSRFFELYQKQPSLGFDITWIAAHEEALVDDNLLTVGRRSAAERIAYLLVSLHDRLVPLDLVTNDTFDFPLTQYHIADALGLSLVHTNKTLKKLMQRQLIAISDRKVRISDQIQLRELAKHDGNARAPRPLI